MKCVIYRKKGTAQDVLECVERPTPKPQKGEVLVRLATSGINPSDVKMRGGQGHHAGAMPFPEIIPHSDGAGIIAALGDGVKDIKIGTRVYVFNGAWQRAHGTAAEYIALPASQVLPLPKNISFAQGATLGIPAMTAAHSILSGGKHVKGGRILISGGGGVVGRMAIQMARAAGAKQIIATATQPLSIKTASDAGADHVLNYRDADLATQILDLSGGITHAIEAEFGQNADMLAEVLCNNASICAYGSAGNMRPEMPFYPLMFKNIHLTMMLVYLLDAPARTRAAKAIDTWLKDGMLDALIALNLPLDAAAEAHEAVEAGSKAGSVILTITDEF